MVVEGLKLMDPSNVLISSNEPPLASEAWLSFATSFAVKEETG